MQLDKTAQQSLAQSAHNHKLQIQQKRQMQQLGLICGSIWLLFIAIFPLAYWRVSHSGKYTGGAFNTLTWEDESHYHP